MITALLAICLSLVSMGVLGFLFFTEREHQQERRSLTNKALAKSTQELMEYTAVDLHKPPTPQPSQADDLVAMADADMALFEQAIHHENEDE